VVAEVYRQQQWMYDNKTQTIQDRIVSLSQPHIRPIVRGKAGTPVEFGAKLSVSLRDGYVFLDRIDWNNFNESGDLKAQVQAFTEYTGVYPESVHVDRVYRTRENRVMAKLPHTSQTAIAITFLVLNLSTLLRQVFCVFLCFKQNHTLFWGQLLTQVIIGEILNNKSSSFIEA